MHIRVYHDIWIARGDAVHVALVASEDSDSAKCDRGRIQFVSRYTDSWSGNALHQSLAKI